MNLNVEVKTDKVKHIYVECIEWKAYGDRDSVQTIVNQLEDIAKQCIPYIEGKDVSKFEYKVAEELKIRGVQDRKAISKLDKVMADKGGIAFDFYINDGNEYEVMFECEFDPVGLVAWNE